MPRVSNSQKWAKRYSNCKSSLFKALYNPTDTWQGIKEQKETELKNEARGAK